MEENSRRERRISGDNVILIGMPSAGKSMCGVLLAKRLGYRFMDTDLLIQERTGKLLSEIIAQDGLERFLEIENEVNASVAAARTVIAPGGSAVYGAEAMENFRRLGRIIYLKISYEEMLSRIGDAAARGVALRKGMTLRDMYEERLPLFEMYADDTVEEGEWDPGATVDRIREILR